MRIRISILVLAVLIFCGSALAGGWPQLQHDAARSGRSDEAVAPPFRPRWIWLGPTLTLRNKDSHPGDSRWADDLRPRDGMRLPLPRRMDYSFAGSMQPIVVDGRVFVADAEGHVYAVSLADGATLWQAEEPGGSLWTGVAAGHVVVFASVLGYVTGYDGATGKQLWQIDTGRSITGAPALLDGVIYIVNQGGSAYAIRLADGNPLWRSDDLGGPVQGGLCVANGRVYLGTEAMQALALDAKTGKVVARRKLTGQSFRFLWPVAARDSVIFTTVPLICPGSEYVNDAVLAGTADRQVGWKPGIQPGYSTIAQEQQALRKWLASDGGKPWETCFSLRADTLQKDYIVATAATEGCGAPPDPPALDASNRPLLWYSTAHPTLTKKGTFGSNFSNDLSAFDLATGERVPIDNGKLSGQPTETDNLFGLSTGGDWVYLRQSFRGTFAINLKTSEQRWISRTVHEDGQPNPAALYYGSSGAKGEDGEPTTRFLPRSPASPHGRVGPAIADGKLLFTESFGALTCMETAR